MQKRGFIQINNVKKKKRERKEAKKKVKTYRKRRRLKKKTINELTFPKYLSSSSTYRWMHSKVINSLSDGSVATTKYKLAYLKIYKC